MTSNEILAEAGGLQDWLAGDADDDGAPILVLHVNEKCNAQCAHCVVDSGPRRQERLPLATARAAITSAAQDLNCTMVVFSGGEPFFYLNDVLALCGEARSLGLGTRIISNGYWARSPIRAAEFLTHVARAGCEELAISFDVFHLPFVAADRVRNVWLGVRLAEQIPKLVFTTVVLPDAELLRPVAMADGTMWPRGAVDIVDRYGFPHERCVSLEEAARRIRRTPESQRAAERRRLFDDHVVVSWQVVVNAGRAGREIAVWPQPDPMTVHPHPPCLSAGRQITVTADGRYFPCCSTWSNFKDKSFGQVGDPRSFADGVQTMQSSGVIRMLREHGPAALASRLRRREASLPTAYSDICHACETLLTRFAIEELNAAADMLEQTIADIPPAEPRTAVAGQMQSS